VNVHRTFAVRASIAIVLPYVVVTMITLRIVPPMSAACT